MPGWSKVEDKPHLNYRMKKIDYGFDAPSGRFEVHWEIKDRFEIKVVVPHGVHASIVLPSGETHEVTGGEHVFSSSVPDSLIHPFDIHTPLLDLLMSEDASAILKNVLPQVYEVATGDNIEFKLDSLESIQYWYGTHIEEEDLEKALEQLGKLER